MAGLASDTAQGNSARPEAMVAGHVSLDVYPALSGPVTLDPGALVEVGPAVISTGGAVANVGVALHRLGVSVRLAARVGADLFGTAVLDALRDRDPRLADGITVRDGEATSYTIVVNPPGVDRSFLHCAGANQNFTADDVPYDTLDGVRIFHFGYPPLMPRMYADDGAGLRAMFERVRATGTATSLDLCDPDPDSDAGRLDWPRLLSNVLPAVDVFAPSVDELLFMFDRPAHARLAAGERLSTLIDHGQVSDLAADLLAMGTALVAVKLGDHGLYLRTGRDAGGLCGRLGLPPDAWSGREILSPCFVPRAVRGTTGSGDATIAGLLAALLRGANPVDAATAATAVGAFSVETSDPTSGIPNWDEVWARIAAGWERSSMIVAQDLPSIDRCSTGTIAVRR